MTITELRRTLHSMPELSGAEARTAALLKGFLETTGPSRLIPDIAGHGIAALYGGGRPGPVIMVRCELDALPRPDGPGAYHGCGHDGHMAIAAGLAERLGSSPPERGSVLVLFQPAEETGAGAALVLADRRFAAVMPDMAVALHNIPGFPMGRILLKAGVFAAASTGITVRLRGTRSHAGEPHKGNNPAMAMAQIIQTFSAVPQFSTGLNQFGKVTVVHAGLGARAFGTSPDEAVVMAVIRALDAGETDRLYRRCETLATGIAAAFDLEVTVEGAEEFPPTVNDAGLTAAVERAAGNLGMRVLVLDRPFPWSEDFGRFAERVPGVLFGLGAGEDTAPLHGRDYRFPDELLQTGTEILLETVRVLARRGSG